MLYILLYSNISMQGTRRHKEFSGIQFTYVGLQGQHADGFVYDYLLVSLNSVGIKA